MQSKKGVKQTEDDDDTCEEIKPGFTSVKRGGSGMTGPNGGTSSLAVTDTFQEKKKICKPFNIF